MGRVLKWAGGIVLILVLVASFFIVRTLVRGGTFTEIEPHFAGTCTTVDGVPGGEDLLIDRGTRTVYVSAYDRRAVAAGNDINGGIYAFFLDDEKPVLKPLEIAGRPQSFRPHGISLYSGEGGTKRLFVVNHPADGRQTVEIFDLTGAGLRHVATVEDPETIISPNDVVGVGPAAFYVSNDAGNPPGLMRQIERYGGFAVSTVAYFDGEIVRTVVDGLAMGNGINVSNDGNTIYVAETLGETLHMYDRDSETGALSERDSVNLGSGLDNIDVAADGSLWIASHPKMLRVIAHAADPDEPAPSQVIKVTVEDGQGGTADEIYLSDGEPLSGASTAAVLDGTMIVGAIFDPEILICELP